MPLSFPLVACLHLDRTQVLESVWLSLHAFTSHLIAEFRAGQGGKGAPKFWQKIGGGAGGRICFKNLSARSNRSWHSSLLRNLGNGDTQSGSRLRFNAVNGHHGIHAAHIVTPLRCLAPATRK
jgi:hypothetical protein